MQEQELGQWIKEPHKYPQCSVCGYYWIETVVGSVGQGKSNLCDANYCPKCGTKMKGVVEK